MGKGLLQTANPTVGTPPAGDRANAVVTGSFLTATGAGQTSQPCVFYGAFNLMIWPIAATSLTTIAAQATKATVVSATNLVAGQTIIGVNVPPGTTVGTKESTVTFTLGGLSTAQIATIKAGTDANATFIGNTAAGVDMTIDLERTADGGTTWVTANIPGTLATLATFHIAAGTINGPVNLNFFEPEASVGYRLNVTATSSGNVGYRISQTSGGAQTYVPATA